MSWHLVNRLESCAIRAPNCKPARYVYIVIAAEKYKQVSVEQHPAGVLAFRRPKERSIREYRCVEHAPRAVLIDKETR